MPININENHPDRVREIVEVVDPDQYFSVFRSAPARRERWVRVSGNDAATRFDKID
jgi:hypothetical protein